MLCENHNNNNEAKPQNRSFSTAPNYFKPRITYFTSITRMVWLYYSVMFVYAIYI